MRQIRFRGKSVIDDKFRYGDLFQCKRSFLINDDFGHDFTVKSYTIGQFTGLKDKTGRDVYEGDIICSSIMATYAITYNDGAFRINQGFPVGFPINHDFISRSEVIGNIHENPELINY